jgi:hypothetical protein
MNDLPMQAGAPCKVVGFTLNGEPVRSETDSRTSLADLLRHGLGRTGTHVGCEHGVCGACTVLVDGKGSALACSSAHRSKVVRSRRSKVSPTRTERSALCSRPFVRSMPCNAASVRRAC